MQNSSSTGTRRGLLLTLLILGMVTVLIFAPSQFPSEAGAKKGDGLFPITKSHEDGIDFFDIRLHTTKEGEQALIQYREKEGKDASFVADQMEKYTRAEADLQTRVPTLKVEYNQDLRILK